MSKAWLPLGLIAGGWFFQRSYQANSWPKRAEEEEEAPAAAQQLRRSTRRNFGLAVNRWTYGHEGPRDVMDVDPGP